MYDFIIVGGGSAGCVLANRLSENADNIVLLIEAGRGGLDKLPFVTCPGAGIYTVGNSFFDWCYQMEADPTCNDRTEQLDSGKLLGGGSAINGMMYIRGNRGDYNGWKKLGNKGWSYEDVLPFFKKIEKTAIGSDKYHGRSGPLGVEYAKPMLDISHRFIEAAMGTGIPFNADINGKNQEGVSRTPCSTYGGIRQSTALAYLDPARKRKNLFVTTGALVERIIFDGEKATGIEYRKNGRLTQVLASKEIILSAGAVRSPQILMLSGIGPVDELEKFDIPLVKSSSGVGLNHMEHPAIWLRYEVDLPTWSAHRPFLKQVIHGLNWLLMKRGPATSGLSQAVAFFRSSPDEVEPDIQLIFIPISTERKGLFRRPTSRNIVSVAINECRPKARGRVVLASANPTDAPLIYPQLLGGSETVKTMIQGILKVRDIFQSSMLKPYVKKELEPGFSAKTEKELEAYLRCNVVDTVHPSGTCKMGQDNLAVVDERLRVIGVENLRIADASIMPTITSGNTNAPVIMIGEKAASMILEDHG